MSPAPGHDSNKSVGLDVLCVDLLTWPNPATVHLCFSSPGRERLVCVSLGLELDTHSTAFYSQEQGLPRKLISSIDLGCRISLFMRWGTPVEKSPKLGD